MRIGRRAFYRPEKILTEVKEKLGKVLEGGGSVDYLTFVPDGEPTIDINLGREIELLKPLGKVAVMTNASLIYRADVREDLARGNLVSLKVDAVSEGVWRRINRPHGLLKLSKILEGMLELSRSCGGDIITETMFVSGVNDAEEEIRGIASFLRRLNPTKAFIAVPTRPPAERWVKPANEQAINMAYQLFSEVLGGRVEFLIGYEGSSFASTGNAKEDLLAITSVHPMRVDAVNEFLRKAGSNWSLIKNLIEEGRLVELDYGGYKFYMRRFSRLDSRVTN